MHGERLIVRMVLSALVKSSAVLERVILAPGAPARRYTGGYLTQLSPVSRQPVTPKRLSQRRFKQNVLPACRKKL